MSRDGDLKSTGCDEVGSSAPRDEIGVPDLPGTRIVFSVLEDLSRDRTTVSQDEWSDWNNWDRGR